MTGNQSKLVACFYIMKQTVRTQHPLKLLEGKVDT
jgi:hypothetical protein